MLLVAAIVRFALPKELDTGAIASGIFLLMACVCYLADTYFALLNMGAFDRPGDPTNPTNAAPSTYPGPGATYPTPGATYPQPPPPTGNEFNRAQPFTPPPVYSAPAGLDGTGPYSVPGGGTTGMTGGDLSHR